jgi:hypothetical protein
VHYTNCKAYFTTINGQNLGYSKNDRPINTETNYDQNNFNEKALVSIEPEIS